VEGEHAPPLEPVGHHRAEKPQLQQAHTGWPRGSVGDALLGQLEESPVGKAQHLPSGAPVEDGNGLVICSAERATIDDGVFRQLGQVASMDFQPQLGRPLSRPQGNPEVMVGVQSDAIEAAAVHRHTASVSMSP
jgi:hypothetical protein